MARWVRSVSVVAAISLMVVMAGCTSSVRNKVQGGKRVLAK